MWWRGRQAPSWVLGTGQGLLFAAAFAAGSTLLNRGSFTSALPSALVAGVIFGALTGRASARTRRGLVSGPLSQATAEQRQAGARAARGGTVPTDPVAHQVAVHLAQQRLEAARRRRVRQLLTFAVFIAVYVGFAVAWSRWWLLAAALFAFFLVLAWVEPARLQRRMAGLTR